VTFGTGYWWQSESRIGFLKRVLGRNSPFVIVFIEASRNFILDVFHKKIAKIVKTISAPTKLLF
jgi:hypothetical protein